MNKAEMELMLDSKKSPTTYLSIGAFELEDQTERTLLFGINGNYNVHIYLQDGHIHKYLYPANSTVKYREHSSDDHWLHFGDLLPKTIDPHFSDFEFCDLLLKKSAKLSFNPYLEVPPRKFHGQVAPKLTGIEFNPEDTHELA